MPTILLMIARERASWHRADDGAFADTSEFAQRSVEPELNIYAEIIGVGQLNCSNADFAIAQRNIQIRESCGRRYR